MEILEKPREVNVPISERSSAIILDIVLEVIRNTITIKNIGITSAIVIAKNIMDGKIGYVDKYLEMLSKGGVEDSLDLLKSVGVDLTKKETYDIAFNYFNEKLEELKMLI